MQSLKLFFNSNKGIMADVRPFTLAEVERFRNLSFDRDELLQDIGTNDLNYKSKIDTLLHMWRYPSLSIHGVEGMFSDRGFKSVIPAKAITKFSMRTVSNQMFRIKRMKVQSLVHDCLY
jgi:hypothetical protein